MVKYKNFKKLRQIVFLDRDGVLNKNIVQDSRERAPHSLVELEIYPDVFEGIVALRNLGFLLVVVTNQPDISTGKISAGEVDNIHSYLLKSLSLDRILFCPHSESEGCKCRKPKPGLIERGLEEYMGDRNRSFLIGDRWRDIEAARAARIVPIFIKGRSIQSKFYEPDCARVDNFTGAVNYIKSYI